MGVETWLRDALNQIAGSEAVAKNRSRTGSDVQEDRPDRDLLLMIGGACLILGLFTRLAAFALGLFLLSVVLLQPFWLRTP